MNSIRQLGSGLLYAVVSVVLVVGGLSLALAEGVVKLPAPTAKPAFTAVVPSSTPTAAMVTLAVSAAPVVVTPSSTPQAMIVTATRAVVTATASPRTYPTSTRAYYATAVHCGPYYGWIKSYTVKQGDTLFHIATLYQTTVNALQIANCEQDTIIFPGDVLWVPNVATITPGVTIIPTFATPTSTVTQAVTPVPAATETVTPSPTDTAIPNPDP